MSASVGTTQQPLGIGIGKIGSAVFAVALAAVVAASLMLGVPSLVKPAVPAAGLAAPAAAMDHGSRTELGAPAIAPNANLNDHGSRGELGAPVKVTLPESFGGWNGPRIAPAAGGGIDKVDHGARDDAGTGTGGSNGPRLRAQ